MMMQPVLHFLIRLCHLMEYSSHQRQVRASPDICKDRRLFLHILDKAAAGVNLNLVMFCMPTHVYRADACPAGLGSYSLEGQAWRFLIPPHLQRCATINFLERIAVKVGL